MKRLSILFILLLWLSACRTQQRQTRFESLSDQMGMPLTSVTSIFQDSRGFIWIGGYSGLFRYDGYEIIPYYYDPHDPHSIGGNKITCMLEDRQGNLWIGTQVGLNYFDRKTEKFTRFFADEGRENDLPDDFIISIYEDRSGNIWIIFNTGLCLYHPEDNTFSFYQPPGFSATRKVIFRMLYEDDKGVFWMHSPFGLFLFDKNRKSFSRLEPGEKAAVFSSQPIYSILEDKRDKLWIGTADGFFQFDPANSASRQFFLGPRNSLENECWGILLGKNNLLWIVTSKGLARFSVQDQTFEHFEHRTGDPYSLNHSYISALTEDRTGILWIGSQKGVNQFNPASEKFQRYITNYHGETPEVTRLRSFYEIEPGQLLMWGKNGLEIFHWREGRTTPFPHKPTQNLTAWNKGINCFFEDGEQKIWMGGPGGVFSFDRKDRAFFYLPPGL